MSGIILLLALLLWLIVRTAAKISARKLSELNDDHFEEGETERQSVRSYENIFLKYTVITAVCLAALSILLTIATLGSEHSPHYIFEEFRYIFFKRIYFITIEGLNSLLCRAILVYVVVSAHDLVIMTIRLKHTKKILKIVALILITVVLICIEIYAVVVCGLSGDIDECKVYERKGYSLALEKASGFMTSEIYIFEVRSMTDVRLRNVLEDCEIDDIIDVEWENNKAVITYEESNFLQGSWEESVVVYFSD